MSNTTQPRPGFLAAGHSLILVLLYVFATLRIGSVPWAPPGSNFIPLALLLGGYAIAALIPIVGRWRGKLVQPGKLFFQIGALFGIVFLYFLVTKSDFSKVVILGVFVAALLLVPLSVYLGQFQRAIVVALLAVVVLALAGSYLRASKPRSHETVATVNKSAIKTGFYNVRSISYEGHIPIPAVRGGGLTTIGNQYLLGTGDGHFYVFEWTDGDDKLAVKSLPYRVPINGDDFAAAAGGKWQFPTGVSPEEKPGEDTADVVITWWFKVAGVLLQEHGDQVRLFASHYFWKKEEKCWVERVSMMEGPRQVFLDGAATADWQMIFESTPCLPLTGENRRRGTPFAGHFGGGRLAMKDDNSLLLTVGDFGFNGVASRQIFSQDPSASYGKTILINVQDRTSQVFSLGHRNPQGLYIDPKGLIWDTEHGPQGGDELNLVKQGLNYGWPMVIYGTDYGTFNWPLSATQGEHDGYELPMYAWLPSIGISNVIGIEKDTQFPIWRGDLLVSSLAGHKLQRMKIRNDRVVYVEPMDMGNKRIRDLVEGADGRIVLWTDDSAIVSLMPLVGSSGEVLFATNCSGCHKVGDGTSHRIGPDLWGVVGRKVASAHGYTDYSPGMRSHGGEWTEKSLDEFLKSPQGVVPGTAMEIEGVADPQARTKIIDYLKHAERVTMP